MNRSSIIKCQLDLYSRAFPKTSKGKLVSRNLSAVYDIPLLAKLSKEQLFQLQESSGSALSEVFRINSSSGLCVNYFALFEQTHKGVVVEFEWKESIPLLDSHAPSNLDARYESNGVNYFIEGKFLEPYCDKNKSDLDGYLTPSRYPFHQNVDKWVNLFEKSSTFKYYNFGQLCCHLLAIFRYYETDGNKIEQRPGTEGKSLCLRSVTWKMTEVFEEKYKELGLPLSDLAERKRVLCDEQKRCEEILNGFIKEIGWTRCHFEAIHYNDVLDDIAEADRFKDFMKQYYFEK